MSIELVIQTPSGRIPVKAKPSTTLAQVVGAATIDDDENEHDAAATSLRYLQTSVHKSQWETMTLQNLGLASGARALLILESNTSINNTTASNSDTDADVVMQDASSNDDTADALKQALSKILSKNFDDDSQVCIVTLIKVLDNVLQKPGNAKVRTIRLSNATVQTKVVSKGGVDYLLASGFCRQASAPELLSTHDTGEECLVLTAETESTSHLIKARRLLMQTAIADLKMNANDLPKYKPPPAATTTSSSTSGFNPYKSNRHNATGQPQQPDAYESTTETKLKQLQSRQERLEAQLQGQQLEDREFVAFRPNEQANNNNLTNNSVATNNTTSAQPSDGALLAQRMKRLEQERKEREEGGFTTKAMRDLQKMKNAKVYSHAKLRIQFPDASAIEAKFLPKETVETVKQVVQECLITSYKFDLYVAPPRRQLDVSQTLQQEGLVPAAKCFVSWKGGGPATGSAFIKEHLFQSQAAAPSFPTAKPVVQEAKRKNNDDSKPAAAGAKPKKSSREEDLLARMMGGKGGGGNNAKKAPSDGTKGGKPKWFKG